MRGASLVELVVALGLTLTVSGLVTIALVEAGAAFAWQPASGELAARGRAVARTLADDLAAAGAGPHARAGGGPPSPIAPGTARLAAWMPPILPRAVALGGGDPDTAAADDRFTVVTIEAGAAQAEVRRVPPRWRWVPGPTCPALVDGCGFPDGVPVLALGPGVGFQLGAVIDVDADGLAFDPAGGLDEGALAEATLLAEVSIVSYRFDRARAELLRARAGGRALPMIGDVVAFAVEYWGDVEPPARPWPAAGTTCLAAADGTPTLPRLAADATRLVRLEAAGLGDGPWCGTPPFRFDADLLRVRRVRVRLRLQAEGAAHRGRDARFARPGTARPAAEVPDLDLVVDVAPAALRGGS